MLVLTRKINESIVIDNYITVTIVDIRGDKIRVGIAAPSEILVHRKEVFDVINRDSGKATSIIAEALKALKAKENSTKENITDTNDPAYHINILIRMLTELPPGVREPICAEFDALLASIDAENLKLAEFWNKIKAQLSEELTSLGVDLKYIEFDLESTKRERDELRNRLDDQN